MNTANGNINGVNNFTSYGDITLNDIMNPLEYLSSSRSMKLSPQDEILSKSIAETIHKQKSVKQFLEDLDRKYKNEENIYDNNDILDNYGTYLGNMSKNYNDIEKEIPTWNQTNKTAYNNININNSSKWRNMNINNSYNESNNSYYSENLSNSMSKINSIYEEYERYKNKFKANSYNIQNNYQRAKKYNSFRNYENSNSNIYLNLNPSHSINSIHSNLLHNPINKNNDYLGRNKALYHKNILDLSKLNSADFNKNNFIENNNNESDEDDENNEILVMNNNENENINTNNDNIKINGITPIDINSPKNIDLIIKYRLPDNNMNVLRIENVNILIKIQTLRNEIKFRINNELKLKGIDNIYSIEKISLLVPGSFLSDTKSLQDYGLESFDFTIQAFITYSNNNKKEKKSNKNKTDNENNINKNLNIKENELVPEELIPKLTKEGYKCSPSILQLSRKTAKELRKVSGFKIYNKYGEVEFKEPVNLLGLNLDNQIVIEKNLIDTGDKLNYWSLFRLYNFKVEENGLNKYKVNLEQSGGNFLEYKNNEIVWEYKKSN